ncbi:MAG: HlyC/CorC family transporter [Lysobacterales bacterium]
MNDDVPSSNGSEPKSWLEKLGHALTGGEPRNREDLLKLLQESLERDILDKETFAMLEGAMEVSSQQVRDAMIPRGQMVCVSAGQTLAELLPLIVESGHSRFPVIKDDKDEVVGILLAKDLLRFFDHADGFSLEQIQRDVAFIPESKRLNVLLEDFRSSRNHMAVVVDEYGGVAGLITIEDVLEEIVGEIGDEYDEEQVEFIRAADNGQYSIDALTPIDDFNDHFSAELPDADFDTVGGLVTGELGRLPETGEKVAVGDHTFTIVKADSRRLLMLGLSTSKD